MTPGFVHLIGIGLLAVEAVQFFYAVRILQGRHQSKFAELHHFYYGAVLVVQPWWWVLWPVGLVIALDDSEQHFEQLRDPEFQSPLHKAYAWVYRHLPRWVSRRLP